MELVVSIAYACALFHFHDGMSTPRYACRMKQKGSELSTQFANPEAQTRTTRVGGSRAVAEAKKNHEPGVRGRAQVVREDLPDDVLMYEVVLAA